MVRPERRALLPSMSQTTEISQDRDEPLLSLSSCFRPIHYLRSCTPRTSMPWAKIAQYVVSLTLLVVCVTLCTVGILAKQTPVAAIAHPAVALALMWALILWLGILEGGQGCLVGLQPVDSTQFQKSHPHTYACTQLAHTGDNLNRFIVGRQFLVVLVVFMLNLACTVTDDFDVPGVPHALMSSMVASGLAVMLITVMLGQLAAEVNATNCMLDFINSPIVWVTTAICLVVEASGLLHSVYLVQCFFSTESISKENTNKTPRQQVWYWTRVLVSTILLIGALAVTFAALWHDETTMYPGLTTTSSFALFFGLVCFLGILEAIQIAVFAVVKLPTHIVAESPAADTNCQLVFRGRNFKAVLIGRQICVTTSMFLLARITTTNVDPTDLLDTSATMSTVLGIPAALQDFFNTGLPGALITTIVASLWWRILAASFPIAFMGNPVVHWIIRLCLCLEASGIFSAAWLLADGIKWIMGIQPDDVYLTGNKTTDSDDSDLELDKSGNGTVYTVSSGESEDDLTDYGSSRGREDFEIQVNSSLSF